MRFAALATDYDGTLAHHGVVDDEILKSVVRLRENGRKLLLVTGRRLNDLFSTFRGVQAFNLVVAENGALLYDPSTQRENILAQGPPPEFAKALARAGVKPLDCGRVIVAALEKHKEAVVETISHLGLELQIIFNKGALMILPAGVTKATGLEAALGQLRLSRHNVVAIGDAENDHAFLSACECAAAVSNAIPALKERADIVTAAGHGRGVIEIVDGLLKDDLLSISDRLARHNLLLGTADGDRQITVPLYGTNLLTAGPSGAGKSTLMTGAMERLVNAGYQLCVLDPEGDYQTFPKSIILGDAKNEPPIEGVLQALEEPDHTIIVNLVGMALENRPDYFERLMPRLADMQAKYGRPHWIVADEVHHLAPVERVESGLPGLTGFLGATMDPSCITPELLRQINTIVAVGRGAGKPVASFAQAVGAGAPDSGDLQLEKSEAVLWRREYPDILERFRVAPNEAPRTRHSRKYAEAILAPDRSFYFRGPKEKLNLRASNLITFVQMMEGVDGDTFAYHLGRSEYSHWFRNNIKNKELAEAAEEIEKSGLEVDEAKAAIKRAIEERYTLPG
jgi:hydroxymethylpyrimidine pyrophosphatase-like HAD family hydrolase